MSPFYHTIWNWLQAHPTQPISYPNNYIPFSLEHLQYINAHLSRVRDELQGLLVLSSQAPSANKGLDAHSIAACDMLYCLINALQVQETALQLQQAICLMSMAFRVGPSAPLEANTVNALVAQINVYGHKLAQLDIETPLQQLDEAIGRAKSLK